jgi:hypothetical protein
MRRREVTLDQFDTEITFTTEHTWRTDFAQAGAVILLGLDQQVAFTRAVLILSAEPFKAESVDEWLELHDQDGVTVEDRQETQVGGVCGCRLRPDLRRHPTYPVPASFLVRALRRRDSPA